MLELLCYLASQTLRGTFYIVFMLTLQRLLRKRLSPRVRAFLWAPLLFVLFAPNLCVVRVPVSQPVETTVVDALEQTRVALSFENAKIAKSVESAKFAENLAVDSEPSVDEPTVPPSSIADALPPFPATTEPEPIAPFELERVDESFAAAETPPTFDERPTADVSAAPDVPEPVATDAPSVLDAARLAETAPLPEPPVPTLEESTPPVPVAPPVETPVERRARWFGVLQTSAFVAVAIWAFGLVVALLYLVRSARVCRRWVRLSAPVDDADVLALYRRCAASLEIAAPPRLATTTDLSSPALLGWRRPVVLVPSEYVDDLSEERLKHVLLHELGHFKRGDAATGFLAFVVLATHWFNPLFWLAARSFYATREEACDAIALGSPALTNPNSAAEYARTLCEIAGRRPFVEQAFGAVGFSPTFRSLRRRVETLGRFGTWGRRAAIGCLLASLGAASFATVRLRPDVDANSPSLVADSQEKRDSREFAKLRRVAESLEPAIPQASEISETEVPALGDDDPIAVAAREALENAPDAADRLVAELEGLQLYPDGDGLADARSLGSRQTFAARTVARLRAALDLGEAEYFATLGDYLTRQSGFFWRFVGVDASPREVETILDASARGVETVSAFELDAVLDRVEKTGDSNFRVLAKLHRALALETRTAPTDFFAQKTDFAEKITDCFVLTTLDGSSKRVAWNLTREFDAGRAYLAKAAELGNARAATRLACVENVEYRLEEPRNLVDGVESSQLSATQRSIFDKKVKLALDGAEAGSAEAQALAAVYLARGVAGKRDLAEALRWGRLFYAADVAYGDALSPGGLGAVPPSRRLFLKRSGVGFKPDDVVGVGPLNCSKYWTTFLWLTEAALDSEPTPENLALAEKFLRRANRFESRSPFAYRAFLRTGEGQSGNAFVLVRYDDLRVTSGFVEANERLADAFSSGAFGVRDQAKADEFKRFAREFADEIAQDAANDPVLKPVVASPVRTTVSSPAVPADASEPFVAPPTPEFEAVAAPIFARLEKTLVDAKNGNADALTARFNEYFDDATDLYPNGRPGAPEVARYKVERLTQEIERLEQTDADAATLDRLRQTRDSWRRLAAETPVVATNA
ncbi:MAG: hypothetical protein IJ991_09805 [Thermoguttaceae bacterium]|nr:hypothetical protein [Thermoguttaceae bacterium]